MTARTGPCAMSRHVAGHALHALEPDEELAVTAHLRGCAECAQALRGHHAVLGALGAAVPSAAPPPRLRERILRAANGEPVSPLRVVDGGVPAPTARARTLRRRRSAAAAAVFAIVVGGLAGQASSLAGQRDTAIAQAQELGRIVTGLDTSGSRHATLTDGHGAPVAAVVVGSGAVQVVTADLRANDAAHTVYVLWGLDGAAAPQALGTFDAGPAAPEVVRIASTAPVSAYAVSVEPGRAAPVAPTEVVASGQVVV
ncbi:MAG: anti-sigma factor [Pseudonocardiaceae bacterium]|nr:MAG: anti-sigma factor [Pseudonocardiaceae bacterium]